MSFVCFVEWLTCAFECVCHTLIVKHPFILDYLIIKTHNILLSHKSVCDFHMAISCIKTNMLFLVKNCRHLARTFVIHWTQSQNFALEYSMNQWKYFFFHLRQFSTSSVSKKTLKIYIFYYLNVIRLMQINCTIWSKLNQPKIKINDEYTI